MDQDGLNLTEILPPLPLQSQDLGVRHQGQLLVIFETISTVCCTIAEMVHPSMKISPKTSTCLIPKMRTNCLLLLWFCRSLSLHSTYECNHTGISRLLCLTYLTSNAFCAHHLLQMTEFSLSLRNIFMRCIDGGVVWRSEHTFQESDSLLSYGCQVSSSDCQAQRKVSLHTEPPCCPFFFCKTEQYPSVCVCTHMWYMCTHVLRNVEGGGQRLTSEASSSFTLFSFG